MGTELCSRHKGDSSLSKEFFTNFPYSALTIKTGLRFFTVTKDEFFKVTLVILKSVKDRS